MNTPLSQNTPVSNLTVMKTPEKIGRKELIDLLNEDLSREYQAIIAYIIYSQTIKGAAYNHIAKELELHAGAIESN